MNSFARSLPSTIGRLFDILLTTYSISASALILRDAFDN